MSKQKYPTTVTTVTTDGKPKRGKVNGYHSEKLHANRDKKRQEAKARQRHYDMLNIESRIALAKRRRGNSRKELAHLLNSLNVKPVAAPVKVPQPVTTMYKQAESRHDVVIDVAIEGKKTRKSDIVKAAKAQRPSKS